MDGDTSGERLDYFEQLYAGDADPWHYHDCAYEIAKRADTLSFLREHYASGCEIGCSIGVLTGELAPRCDHLLAIDISPAAAAIARTALRDFPQVEVAVMHVPHDRPSGTFDLLVLSEVLYFLGADEIARLAAMAQDLVVPGGDVIIVSYDGETRTRLNGRASTAAFLAHAAGSFDLLASVQRQEYHNRLLRRRDG